MQNKKYDYLIVGSGFFGAVCAYELNKIGKKCLVVEKRDHIGGNAFTYKTENINVHKYGAHIFHTSDKFLWDYIQQFASFNNYQHHVVANYKGEIFSLPFNMFTFNKLWNVVTPNEAKNIINKQKYSGEISNLEQQALALVGKDVYEKLIKGYTQKQWMKSPKNLPAFIIKRLPVRFNYDNNYYDDTYQGIPVNGYTEIFKNLLDGIEVKLNTDYFENRPFFDNISTKIIYTGPIDKYFNYKFGRLEYRSLRFENKLFEEENFQGHSVVNYTDAETPFTRIIEHKHFNKDKSKNTLITYEYPELWNNNTEPFYPINDKQNNEVYKQYKEESKKDNNIFFGGRLAEYRYYDMHQVLASALKLIKEIKISSD